MTQPGFVLRGDTVMITRRTLRRHHLFRPDVYFCPDNRQWPEAATLSLTMPPGLAERYGAEEMGDAVAKEDASASRELLSTGPRLG